MEIVNKDIDNGQGFDWGRTSGDYAKFRDIYPEVFYQKLIGIGLCVKGQRVLDIGTGTGVLPRNLYKYGAEFTGADISENQIEQARRLSKEAGMDISYVVSPAETLDFPGHSFDVVTASQCYTYFDKDVIFPKIHSILKPAGHFCISLVVWTPGGSVIADKSEALVVKFNPSWSPYEKDRFPYSFPEQAQGLFEVAHSLEYETPVTFTRESWHGRMRTCRGISAASCMSAEEIARWEKEHIEYLQSVPEVFDIPHLVTVLNLRKI